MPPQLAMITDHRKFPTKITLYGISSLHFYRGNLLKVIPLYTPCQKPPNFLRRPTRVDNTVDNADIAANHHRLLSHVKLGFVKCRK